MSQLELNKGDNFIFAVDVSGSMGTRDCPGGAARIDYLKENVITFAKEASKWDEDGIDVLTFGHQITPFPKVTAEKAEALISGFKASEASTDTAGAIREAYKLHKAGGYAQTVLFLATDGAPNDKNAVKDAIRTIASELKDEHEFAISILTVGEIDSALGAFLTELDDDLKAKHDIVDVKKLTDVDFMDIETVWAEHKKAILTTVIVVVVGILVIKFFDFIFWGSMLVALAVAVVLAWNYLAKKHGGLEGVWKALLKEFGFKP